MAHIYGVKLEFSRSTKLDAMSFAHAPSLRLNVDIQDMANHFNSIMTDDGCLDGNQINIRNEVSIFIGLFKITY